MPFNDRGLLQPLNYYLTNELKDIMKIITLSSEEIKQQLSQRDILLSDIAQALDVTGCLLTSVIQGGTSRRVAQAISNALNLPINEVFGDKYNKPPQRGRKDRTLRKEEIKQALLNNKHVPFNPA